ncbi:chitinase-3-like protein 1 [Elysia marginata]|uniref:Chitinase-3-like protein 1 n=1 Tax=Elysia marginata TaxID=1093978 RepID=A0AAV4HZC7_9GAST|nr:chitinase-3-like protein 1 [Elysia marginata]
MVYTVDNAFRLSRAELVEYKNKFFHQQDMALYPATSPGWLSIFIVLAIGLSVCSLAHGKHIFCYYSSFAYNRHGRGNFLPEDINPHLCTHIIYAFVDISSDGKGLVPFNDNDQGDNGLYARTLALKKKNPELKVLLAVGGWLIGSQPFIPVVRSETSREVWIHNVVKYLRKHGFDGFDMDWEFPATRGSPPLDKFRFTQLMKGLFEAFARDSAETGRERLLLTMATASGTYYISQSYETTEITKYLDFMLLMTYNYHGQWEKLTGHHSGLYPHRTDPKSGEKSQLYQEWSIDFWLDAGIPKEKLIVGIPTYAMTFTLSDQSQHAVRSPAVMGGKQGEFTRETGILAYYEAKNIMKRDLGGAFVWSVEMGDFDGYCGQGPYPLIQAINDVIGHGDVTSVKLELKPPHQTTQHVVAEDTGSGENNQTWWFRSSPRPPTTGWTRTRTKAGLMKGRRRHLTTHSSAMRFTKPVAQNATSNLASSKGLLICPANGVGLFPHPQSCDHYVICQHGSWSDQPYYVMSCPAGTRFDPRLRICNFANSVLC